MKTRIIQNEPGEEAVQATSESGKSLPAAVAEVARFTPTASYQRFAYVCGALLALSGLFHLVVYLVDGGPWGGPLSWRKPIVFGLSFGITLVTIAWLMPFLRARRLTGWIVVGLFAVASLAEVFLISMQTWRGVASHFNETTQFDSSVFSFMGMLVMLLAVLTVYVTVRSFFRMDAPPSLALAIRLGLLLMLVSQAVGAQMIAEGGNTFGAAGALKVPHAVTLHAVQVLPALAILLLVARSTERRRVKIVALGAVGYAVLIASTLVQTYDGRGPLDLSPLTSVLALVGIAILAVVGVVTLNGIRPGTR
ncbi:hypothetical protein EV652_101102 [Kribbella steppae]|uniref:Uncharacterized protein n=1 Tax=Kribbella steppae TaxID=2512223 RepID=A0A4R2HUT1_9ACTN|nr:hypothetical protein [Kribbella steppae]TCO35223.1 hypothetical protein EV652_101102 [Kribbella steppae]